MREKAPKKGLKAAYIAAGTAFVLTAACAAELFYLPHYLIHKKAVEIPCCAGNEVSIISCNVRCLSPIDLGKKSWLYRADLTVKNLAAETPDIVCFQEVTKIHYGYLCDTLTGFDSVIEYRDNFILSEGCPVFFRTDKFTLIDKGSFWLSETPDTMSKSWGAANYRICSFVILEKKADGSRFAVFNSHLDHISDKARINGINVILEKIKLFGNLPSVITGDFNAGEESETYKSAIGSFDDAKYLSPNPDNGATYQRWGDALGMNCIDYIMLSKGAFTVSDFHIVKTTYDGVYTSDHFPVYAKFDMKNSDK